MYEELGWYAHEGDIGTITSTILIPRVPPRLHGRLLSAEVLRAPLPEPVPGSGEDQWDHYGDEIPDDVHRDAG